MTYPNHPVEPHTQTTGEKLTEAAESVKAKALDTAHTVTSKIAAGTEMLSEEARSRVIAARRKATEAGQSTRQTLRRGRQSAGDFFESQPLVVGYEHSLFGYNSLKWDKRIEPIRYREARKQYAETLEVISATACRHFFSLASA